MKNSIPAALHMMQQYLIPQIVWSVVWLNTGQKSLQTLGLSVFEHSSVKVEFNLKGLTQGISSYILLLYSIYCSLYNITLNCRNTKRKEELMVNDVKLWY